MSSIATPDERIIRCGNLTFRAVLTLPKKIESDKLRPLHSPLVPAFIR